MKTILTGAALAFALAVPAMAAPGQCSVTGFDTFDCDVTLDGGGLTFGLPDGQTFAFALTESDLGTVYLIAPDAQPGARPEELRSFRPVPDQPGCWAREEDFQFCVMVEQ